MPDGIVWTCSCKNHEVILGSGVGEKDDVRNALEEWPGSFVWLGLEKDDKARLRKQDATVSILGCRIGLLPSLGNGKHIPWLLPPSLPFCRPLSLSLLYTSFFLS